MGAKGLYKGYLITLLREVPAWSMYFGVYDIMKEKYGKYAAGATAGFIAWAVAIP